MQRTFTSRGEAHAEAVASRMRASHRPRKGEVSPPLPRRMAQAWRASPASSGGASSSVSKPGTKPQAAERPGG